jgi:alkylhydroperoxidase/carboxymuconolactone decarboxylase family protein YurZ
VASIAPAIPSRLIDLSPTIKEHYEAYFKAVFDGGVLDEKSRATAALAAAMALNNQSVIRSFLTAAKQVGLTNDDLGHVAAIVDVVRIEAHQRAFEVQPKASKSCC